MIQYPKLTEALVTMACCNNGINRDRSEAEFVGELPFILLQRWAADLVGIEKFLGTLTEDEILILVDGEMTEAEAICARAPNPELLNTLLNDVFEEAV